MHSSNPYLDTSLYEIEFNDGHVKSYAANLIAENIYEQLDDVGNKYHLIDEIIDHQKDNSAMSHKDSEYTFRGCTNQKRMTRGWFLCVQWKDGSTSWEHLHDLKRIQSSGGCQILHFQSSLTKEPAFIWWVPFALKRRDRIIKATQTRYQQKWQKYGIEIPKSVHRALEIGQETGTDFWRKALQLEMSKILPAVKILDKNEAKLVGYQQIPCHIVFDVKMDFTRKARYVAGVLEIINSFYENLLHYVDS